MKNKRVLIVEDEKITALDLKLTLIDLGFDVVGTVSSGEDSIAMCRLESPDLVLMDIHLKTDMLGTEAAEIITKELNIPIIFITAYSDADVVKQAVNAKAYGYLVKPIQKNKINAAVNVVLARWQEDRDIRYSDSRLRMALDSANMDVWESTLDAKEKSKVMDNNSTQVIVHTLEDLIENIHPEDVDKIHEYLESSERLNCVVRMKPCNHKKGGSLTYERYELFAAVFNQNEQRKVVGVIKNVEEKYKNEDRLRQASVVFNNTSEGILITDKNQCVITVNPAFVDITGFRLVDVVGHDPDEFLHARRHTDVSEMRIRDKSDKTWSGEVGCYRQDGGYFPAWENISAVFDADGQIINYVFTISNIENLRREEKSLIQMAYRDALTGVGNRIALERKLDELCQDQVKCKNIGVLFIDLDGFKKVNDTLGHTEGDRLLIIIAERLSKSIRDTDFVTRTGGDEFVIVASDVSCVKDIQTLVDKLLKQISLPIELTHDVVEVSASIGIALADEAVNTQDTLICAADAALFQAKNSGRNCSYIYDSALAKESLEKTTMEINLKNAIVENILSIEFQPLIDIQSGCVHGAEALCRWRHDGLDISPERFIPIAEQSDLIIELGVRVLELSCKALANIISAGYDDFVMAVNVSLRQLTDINFPETVRRILNEYNIPPHLLEIEITETSIQNNNKAKDQLLSLRKLGVKMALDDFGTGYSSLSRLKYLPLDRVKIDRTFISELVSSNHDQEICKAIMALCNVMDLAVTAEGVEEPEQLSVLQEMGCGFVQGFYFSKSMPLDDLLSWIDRFDINQY
ncbi:MAG: EAL domain-containing protein [Oleibacter sp.]|nr:EAL domain-containing protein [Thalassolituus sp.]